MKKMLLFIFVLSGGNAFAQLPAAAQLLYDSAKAQDPVIEKYALDSGAKVIATPDGQSFYLQWFPKNAVKNNTPVVVTLHGSHCNAFMEFKSWHPEASKHGVGIIALQWYRYKPIPPTDYFPDDTLYPYLDSALWRINYPSGKAMLHGFSRGGARSYAMVLMDILSGNNYFCTTMANSGDANQAYPLYDSINNNKYGQFPFAGKKWNMFCGGKDTIVGCVKMNNTKTWLQSKGATVSIFIQNSNLNHDGFQLVSSAAYKDSILDDYLKCYNSVSIEEQEKPAITISPNPFSEQCMIRSETPLSNARLVLYNSLGEEVRAISGINGQSIVLRRDHLPIGLYFMRLEESGKILLTKKLLISF